MNDSALGGTSTRPVTFGFAAFGTMPDRHALSTTVGLETLS
jgi:hypothetical protein